MAAWLVPAVVAFSLAALTAANADDAEDCVQEIHPDLAIRACTRLIENEATSEQLAAAYCHRAIAWSLRGKYDIDNSVVLAPGTVFAPNEPDWEHNDDHARADYAKAVELRPEYARASCGHGFSDGMDGNTERARAERRKAVDLLRVVPLPQPRSDRFTRDPPFASISPRR